MKITCPRCNGEKFLHDLTRVQSDLDYPNGKLRQESQYPFGGFPALACDICKGQGWVDITPYLGVWGQLHLDVSGFWVLLDIPIPREAMYMNAGNDIYVIDTSGVTDGTKDATITKGFVVLT